MRPLLGLTYGVRGGSHFSLWCAGGASPSCLTDSDRDVVPWQSQGI